MSFFFFSVSVPGGSLQQGCMRFWAIIGVFVRMIGKTKTKKHIMLYENMIILGGVLGNIMELYKVRLPLGEVFGQIFLLTGGVSVGDIYRLSCYVSGRNFKGSSYIFQEDTAVSGTSVADRRHCSRKVWRVYIIFLEKDGSRMRILRIGSLKLGI